MPSLRKIFDEVLHERLVFIWRIIVCLFGDAVIFFAWIGLGILLHKAEVYAKAHGVSEPYSTTFVIVSSVGTLLLAVGWIIFD